MTAGWAEHLGHDLRVMQEIRDLLDGEGRPSKVRILSYLLRCYEEQTSD